MIKILNLAAFDLFHTEKILNGVFHFKTTESVSTIFDDAGYTGSNFIIGIGPIFLMLVLYAIYLAIRAIVRRNCKEERTYKNRFINLLIQYIMNSFRNHKIQTTCIGFILEGNIEISLWGLICAIYIKNNGIGMPYFSDVFSNIFAFISMVPLYFAPLYLLQRAWKFNKHI